MNIRYKSLSRMNYNWYKKKEDAKLTGYVSFYEISSNCNLKKNVILRRDIVICDDIRNIGISIRLRVPRNIFIKSIYLEYDYAIKNISAKENIISLDNYRIDFKRLNDKKNVINIHNNGLISGLVYCDLILECKDSFISIFANQCDIYKKPRLVVFYIEYTKVYDSINKRWIIFPIEKQKEITNNKKAMIPNKIS